MATTRRGGAVIASGPTDLSRYLPLSLFATAIVAGLPLWVILRLGPDFGLLATALSISLSFSLSHVGARAWKRWPGSRDVVFNDLMLWGFCRRIVTQKRLLKRVDRLGMATADDPDALTLEERTALIKKLAVALETGDPYTHGHSQRVARHAYLVAKTMKLPRRTADKIKLAGVIHDVGKLRIPREIITKPGALTEAEFDVIKGHTVDGAAMVEALGDPELTDMVRHHHERLDGSGYPDRLIGEEISIGARVLAVADTFDAASSLRPYRPAQKHQVALDILKKESKAGRLDPVVVDAFVRYYSGKRGLRWWTVLSTGPAHLHEIPITFAQRLGTASIANAAIVGVTAAALVPGAPLHGLGRDRAELAKSDRPAVVAEERSHGARGEEASAARSENATDGQRRAAEARSSRGRSETKGKTPDTKGKSDQPRRRGKPDDPGSASEGKNGLASDKGTHENNGRSDEEHGPAAAAADPLEQVTSPATGTVKDDGGHAATPPQGGPEETVETTTDAATEEAISTSPANSGSAAGHSEGRGKDK